MPFPKTFPPGCCQRQWPVVHLWLCAAGLLLHPGDCGEVSQPIPVACLWAWQKNRWAPLCWERKLSSWKKRDEHAGLAVALVTRPLAKCFNITVGLVKLSVKSTKDCPFTHSWKVFVFTLHTEFITAIQMNLKKNSYCCGGLSCDAKPRDHQGLLDKMAFHPS